MVRIGYGLTVDKSVCRRELLLLSMGVGVAVERINFVLSYSCDIDRNWCQTKDKKASFHNLTYSPFCGILMSQGDL